MLVALPLFLAALVVPFPAAWVLIFLTCCGLFFNTGPTNTILANVTHPSIRAAGFALNILIVHALGDAISPPLIGKINTIFGDHTTTLESGAAVDELVSSNMNAGFAAVSFAIFLSGILWLLGAKHLQRDTRRVLESEHTA
jgi:hypothetical protein